MGCSPSVEVVQKALDEKLAADRRAAEHRIHKLKAERENLLEKNQAFSFGFNPAVEDWNRAVAAEQIRASQSRPSRIVATYLIHEDDGTDSYIALVDESGGGTLLIDGHDVLLVSEGAGLAVELLNSAPGDLCGIGQIMSANGSPNLSAEELQEKAVAYRERQERERLEELERLRRERAAEQRRAQERRELLQRKQAEFERRRQPSYTNTGGSGCSLMVICCLLAAVLVIVSCRS